MANRAKRGAVAAAAALMVATIATGPASADYAPWVVLSAESAPPGGPVTATNDPSGHCPPQPPQGQGNTVIEGTSIVIELGTLEDLPDIGGGVILDEVYDSVTVEPNEQGNWSGVVTVPDDAALGTTLYVTAHCYVPETDEDPAPGAELLQAPPAPLLFDYYPAPLVVGDGGTATTATVPTTSTPSDVSGGSATPATPVSGQADFTG